MAEEAKGGKGIAIPGTKVKVPPKMLLLLGVGVIVILFLSRGQGGGGGNDSSSPDPISQDDGQDNAGGGNQAVIDALSQFGQQQGEANRSLLTAIMEGFQGLANQPIGGGGDGGWSGGGGGEVVGGGGYFGGADAAFPSVFGPASDYAEVIGSEDDGTKPSAEKGSLTPRTVNGVEKRTGQQTRGGKDGPQKTRDVKTIITPSGPRTTYGSGGGKKDEGKGTGVKPPTQAGIGQPKNRQPEVKATITPSGRRVTENTSGGAKKETGKGGNKNATIPAKPTQPTQPKKPVSGGSQKKGR